MNVSSQIQALGRDPFAELDHALAQVRRCSAEIAQVVTDERPNAAVIDAWSHLRDDWSDRVATLLTETSAILAEAGQ